MATVSLSTDRFYIGGQWVAPSSDAKINVIDSDTEQVYFSVPEAQAADIARAVGAAREAHRRGRFAPAPVAVHHGRTADADLARLSRASRGADGVNKADLEMPAWPADRELREIGVRRSRQTIGGADIGLGRPIQIDVFGSRGIAHELPQQRHRKDLSGKQNQAQ